ncbi:hypothetical protein H310_10245 [Aphanomyces invadans]|uniref:Uncharacterized protein n=1 Tax=Aphanomyces invadans TaxID=157072 RepID=A0A024TQW0_9STRA|nr:hypothetical protein H310_10245 [Aphanomyces invadans]ETV96535.1 hypothetical protein H310_10245 [Aphanomyces invadans]|eukprot:XP_008874798.1 hypothetical protein H310_10245 [Aphanomyces invadans]
MQEGCDGGAALTNGLWVKSASSFLGVKYDEDVGVEADWCLSWSAIDSGGNVKRIRVSAGVLRLGISFRNGDIVATFWLVLAKFLSLIFSITDRDRRELVGRTDMDESKGRCDADEGESDSVVDDASSLVLPDGRIHLGPPPWARHFPPPWLDLMHPVTTHRTPPPCALQNRLLWALLSHPSNSHRLPPP